MRVPSLEETCLIKLAVSFWAREDTKKHMEQANGFIRMEAALENSKTLASALPLTPNLRKRLVDVTERVGYEIYVFLSKSPANDLQNGFDLGEDLKWNNFGVIDEKSTCDCWVRKNPGRHFTNFKCIAMVCDEEKMKQMWRELSNSEKERLKKNNLLVSYWAHVMEDKMNEFISGFAYSILGFDPQRSLDYNMTVHCLNSNLKPGIAYFFERLPPSEKQLLNEGTCQEYYRGFLKKMIKNPKPEHFKFIASFMELPFPDYSLYRTIAKEMASQELEDFLYHLLRIVNIFGDLHYNLFRSLVGMAHKSVKVKLISKLDFIVLNLLTKGRFETFEYLLTENSKLILRQQLSHRLKQSTGLAPFFTICKNNQKHLLEKCFKCISSNLEDETFFSSHLNAILNGSQYDEFY